MTAIVGKPVEAPSILIETDQEFRIALERVRNLEGCSEHSASALERAALEAAIAEFMATKEVRARPRDITA